jgi:hypothetical protein
MLSRTSTSTITNSYGNIHWPSLGPADDGSSKAPNESTVDARRDLLAAHGLQLPVSSAPGATALYKFIDGEQLSRRDSLNLSRWLESERPPRHVEQLAAMQKCAPEFVPTLNLGLYQEDVSTLFTELQKSGATFGVSVLLLSVAARVGAGRSPCHEGDPARLH